MKIAYIILAHKNPCQLIRLVSRLNTENASFFIHIDLNSGNEMYYEAANGLQEYANVRFIGRIKCYWGDFSLVKATLAGIQAILESNTVFDYAVLLSGQDYPLAPAPLIEKFFEKHSGKEFTEYFPLPHPGWNYG